VVDPAKMVGIGDIALLYTDAKTAKLLSIREDGEGNLYGLQVNPDEKVKIEEGKYFALHRVSFISIA